MLANFTFAQDIQGRIRYVAKVDFTKWDTEIRDPNVNMERKKRLESQKSTLKTHEEHTYILTFTKNESSYRQEEKLGLDESRNFSSLILDHYKDLKENRYIRVYDMMGTKYFVSDTLRGFNWTLHPETKTIGQYICNKATYTEKTESMSRTVKPDGTIENTTSIDTTIITAWYCPQLPIMNGPGEFSGLPGLILELTKTSQFAPLPLTLHCTEIAINPAGGVKIQKPRARKLYTPNDFEIEMLKLQGITR